MREYLLAVSPKPSTQTLADAASLHPSSPKPSTASPGRASLADVSMASPSAMSISLQSTPAAVASIHVEGASNTVNLPEIPPFPGDSMMFKKETEEAEEEEPQVAVVPLRQDVSQEHVVCVC